MVTRLALAIVTAIVTGLVLAGCDPLDSRQTYTGTVFDVSGTCHAMFNKDEGKVYAFRPGVVDKYFKKRVSVKAAIAEHQVCPGAVLLDQVTDVEVR